MQHIMCEQNKRRCCCVLCAIRSADILCVAAAAAAPVCCQDSKPKGSITLANSTIERADLSDPSDKDRSAQYGFLIKSTTYSRVFIIHAQTLGTKEWKEWKEWKGRQRTTDEHTQQHTNTTTTTTTTKCNVQNHATPSEASQVA
jgi:hypothetical protein